MTARRHKSNSNTVMYKGLGRRREECHDSNMVIKRKGASVV